MLHVVFASGTPPLLPGACGFAFDATRPLEDPSQPPNSSQTSPLWRLTFSHFPIQHHHHQQQRTMPHQAWMAESRFPSLATAWTRQEQGTG